MTINLASNAKGFEVDNSTMIFFYCFRLLLIRFKTKKADLLEIYAAAVSKGVCRSIQILDNGQVKKFKQ